MTWRVLLLLVCGVCEATCPGGSCDETAKSSILQMSDSSRANTLTGPQQWVEKSDLTALRQMMEDVKQQVGDKAYSEITPEAKSGIDEMIAICGEIEAAIEEDHKADQGTMDDAVVRLESLTSSATHLKRGDEHSADAHDISLVACRDAEGQGLKAWEDCKDVEAQITEDRNQKCAEKERLRTMHWNLNSNLQGEKTCDWTIDTGNPARNCMEFDGVHTQGIDPVVAQFDNEKGVYLSWRKKCNDAEDALASKIAECQGLWDQYIEQQIKCEIEDGHTAVVSCEFGDKLQEKCEQLRTTTTLSGEIQGSDADRQMEWEAVQTVKCLLLQYEEGGTFSGEPCNIGAYPHAHNYYDAKRQELTSTDNFNCNEKTMTFSGFKWVTGSTSDTYQKYPWVPGVESSNLESPPFEWCGETITPPTVAPPQPTTRKPVEPQVSSPCTATVWEHGVGDGWSATFPLGRFGFDDFLARGAVNDQASSIVVEGEDNCVADVYEHGSFVGKKGTYSIGSHSIVARSQNDLASSIQVRQVWSNCKATLYETTDFGGWSAVFFEGDYEFDEFKSHGAKNDQASALVVEGTNCRVEVWQHGDQTGHVARYWTGSHVLKLDNHASAIIVEKADPLLPFIHTLASKTEKSYCSGHYSGDLGYYGTGTDEYECAIECLTDAACVHFIFSEEPDANPCRLSSDCIEYTHASEKWSGYLKKSAVPEPEVTPAPPADSCKATLYQHGDKSGWSATYLLGEYSFEAFLAQGALNDQASFLKVEGEDNCIVEIYQHGSFNGKKGTYSVGEHSLGKPRYQNDMCSSVKVKLDESLCAARLYEHYDFKGWEAVFPTGDYEYAEFLLYGASNDKASSIRVDGAGCVAEVWQHGSLNGIGHIYRTGETNLATNDQASSITVGPEMSVVAHSGRQIALLHDTPAAGSFVFTDRYYLFDNLGDFAGMDDMHYIMGPNDDKNTPDSSVQWTLSAPRRVTIYLDFWGDELHVEKAQAWLYDGWERTGMTGSSFDGKYGPGIVYKKSFEAGDIPLMGNDGDGHGTYCAFIVEHA